MAGKKKKGGPPPEERDFTEVVAQCSRQHICARDKENNPIYGTCMYQWGHEHLPWQTMHRCLYCDGLFTHPDDPV
jgi:hypothetical protein